MTEKQPCYTILCAFRCLIKLFRPEVFNINRVRNYLFLKNYGTSERAVSHNVLSTALHCSLPSKFLCYNNYFELLPIVSSAFNIDSFKMYVQKNDTCTRNHSLVWISKKCYYYKRRDMRGNEIQVGHRKKWILRLSFEDLDTRGSYSTSGPMRFNRWRGVKSKRK